MKTVHSPWRDADDPRRSTRVAVVLLAAAGAVGLPLYMAHRNQLAQKSDGWVSGSDDPPVQLSVGDEYPNDYYVSGAGYYHAPYYAWFPFRYNYYDSNRGYYAGGTWRTLAETGAILRSHPTATAVTAALVLERERRRQFYGTTRSSSGYYGGGSSIGHWFSPGSSARSTSSPAGSESHSGVIRGGFGHSAGHGGAGE